MTKRAQQALQGRFDPSANPAISKLVEFAAQNPGLDFANYGQWDTYNQERASITRDWKRFTKALQAASDAGVSDADVIEQAPRAFSGRLEPKFVTGTMEFLGWQYCTGQYFPTEYRKAAATLLEYATRERLRRRPPAKGRPRTVAELKALNETNGGCWFGKGEMQFFGTRIESGILHGNYFISSEQQDEERPRKFTVRSFNDEGAIDTIGEFHAYHNKADALEALREHLTRPSVPTA